MSAGSSTLFSGDTQGQNSRALLRVIILVLIAGAAIASRLFSVIRESTHFAWSPAGLRLGRAPAIPWPFADYSGNKQPWRSL